MFLRRRKDISRLRLRIKPEIKERVTKWGECGERGAKFIFRGITQKFSGNSSKHSGEYRQTFRGISSNIAGNVAKHSGKWLRTYFYPCCFYFYFYIFISQRNDIVGSVEDFVLLFLCSVWITRIRRLGESKIPLCDPSGGRLFQRPPLSYNKLLRRATLRILSNILMELFYKNSQLPWHIGCFWKNVECM